MLDGNDYDMINDGLYRISEELNEFKNKLTGILDTRLYHIEKIMCAAYGVVKNGNRFIKENNSQQGDYL